MKYDKIALKPTILQPNLWKTMGWF